MDALVKSLAICEARATSFSNFPRLEIGDVTVTRVVLDKIDSGRDFGVEVCWVHSGCTYIISCGKHA